MGANRPVKHGRCWYPKNQLGPSYRRVNEPVLQAGIWGSSKWRHFFRGQDFQGRNKCIWMSAEVYSTALCLIWRWGISVVWQSHFCSSRMRSCVLVRCILDLLKIPWPGTKSKSRWWFHWVNVYLENWNDPIWGLAQPFTWQVGEIFWSKKRWLIYHLYDRWCILCFFFFVKAKF